MARISAIDFPQTDLSTDAYRFFLACIICIIHVSKTRAAVLYCNDSLSTDWCMNIFGKLFFNDNHYQHILCIFREIALIANQYWFRQWLKKSHYLSHCWSISLTARKIKRLISFPELSICCPNQSNLLKEHIVPAKLQAPHPKHKIGPFLLEYSNHSKRKFFQTIFSTFNVYTSAVWCTYILHLYRYFIYMDLL